MALVCPLAAAIVTTHGYRSGHEGLDLGPRTRLPGVRSRHSARRTDRHSGADPRQRRRLASTAERRPANAGTPVSRRVVDARVRMPRPRRLPGLRPTARADAHAGSAAVPEL